MHSHQFADVNVGNTYCGECKRCQLRAGELLYAVWLASEARVGTLGGITTQAEGGVGPGCHRFD